MNTTRDILFARWHELKGQVQQKWPKLTGDDLAQLSGKTEELVVVLQQRYGYAKVQAEIEINNWLNDYNQLDTK
jgi:uncharacterized protein YjbJ (UPF0337 family)